MIGGIDRMILPLQTEDKLWRSKRQAPAHSVKRHNRISKLGLILKSKQEAREILTNTKNTFLKNVTNVLYNTPESDIKYIYILWRDPYIKDVWFF